MHPIISVSELLEIRTHDNLIIADANNGKNARENYDKQHLENTIFASVNDHLADIKADLSSGSPISNAKPGLKTHFLTKVIV